MALPVEHPSVVAMQSIVDAMTAMEATAVKELERLMKLHPLGPWVKAQTGIGFKQGARLLAAIGDPYIRPQMEYEDGTVEPSRGRTVSELWAYSGFSVVNGESQKRRKGQQVNWSQEARMRAWLIAGKCVMQKPGTPWRDCYDAARAKYAESTHGSECVRCGPKGKPALVGSPLSAGHQHARAVVRFIPDSPRSAWLTSSGVGSCERNTFHCLTLASSTTSAGFLPVLA